MSIIERLEDRAATAEAALIDPGDEVHLASVLLDRQAAALLRECREALEQARVELDFEGLGTAFLDATLAKLEGE